MALQKPDELQYATQLTLHCLDKPDLTELFAELIHVMPSHR